MPPPRNIRSNFQGPETILGRQVFVCIKLYASLLSKFKSKATTVRGFCLSDAILERFHLHRTAQYRVANMTGICKSKFTFSTGHFHNSSIQLSCRRSVLSFFLSPVAERPAYKSGRTKHKLIGT